VTWQPDRSVDADQAVVPREAARTGWRWIAALVALAVGLGGLAVAAVGVAHQLMPRQFTSAQESQIMTWEMARRWRALPAGEIFPDSLTYEMPAPVIAPAPGGTLEARRLGIGRQAGCGADVSDPAKRVLAEHNCGALLRATYLDSSGSILVTVALAVLPDTSAASAAASALTAPHSGMTFALGTLAVRGTPAARFRNRQRQLAYATSEGPYVVLATAGFTDGRPHEPLRTDSYYDREMTSLVKGLSDAIAERLGQRPAVPSCPGAPGC
jgi:hypothetical protein